jgi:hypothetical protein
MFLSSGQMVGFQCRPPSYARNYPNSSYLLARGAEAGLLQYVPILYLTSFEFGPLFSFPILLGPRLSAISAYWRLPLVFHMIYIQFPEGMPILSCMGLLGITS